MNKRQARKIALFHAGLIIETAAGGADDIAVDSIVKARGGHATEAQIQTDQAKITTALMDIADQLIRRSA